MQLQFNIELQNDDELIQKAAAVDHGRVVVNRFILQVPRLTPKDSLFSQFVTLVYYVKDDHCFPITDEKRKYVGSKANQGGYKDLLKYMTDLKWSRRHETATMIISIDICGMKKKNHNAVYKLFIQPRNRTSLRSYNGTWCKFLEMVYFPQQ